MIESSRKFLYFTMSAHRSSLTIATIEEGHLKASDPWVYVALEVKRIYLKKMKLLSKNALARTKCWNAFFFLPAMDHDGLTDKSFFQPPSPLSISFGGHLQFIAKWQISLMQRILFFLFLEDGKTNSIFLRKNVVFKTFMIIQYPTNWKKTGEGMYFLFFALWLKRNLSKLKEESQSRNHNHWNFFPRQDNEIRSQAF